MSVTSRSDGSGGKIHSFWAMYSFRMSVWIVPRSAVGRDALALGDADVEGEQDRRRRVDRHRRRDLAERDAGEERLHVGERVDRDALAADLAERALVVGVEPHQRRHVEGGREAGLPVGEQVAEALVRLLRRPEAGELAHRPEAPAVHRRVDAAGERVRAGSAEIALVVDRDVVRSCTAARPRSRSPSNDAPVSARMSRSPASCSESPTWTSSGWRTPTIVPLAPPPPGRQPRARPEVSSGRRSRWRRPGASCRGTPSRHGGRERSHGSRRARTRTRHRRRARLRRDRRGGSRRRRRTSPR